MLESGLAFILFKGLLGFGLPLAFAVQQLWSLRRDERRAAGRSGEVVSLPRPATAQAPAPERRAA